jgi:hypothetical protein
MARKMGFAQSHASAILASGQLDRVQSTDRRPRTSGGAMFVFAIPYQLKTQVQFPGYLMLPLLYLTVSNYTSLASGRPICVPFGSAACFRRRIWHPWRSGCKLACFARWTKSLSYFPHWAIFSHQVLNSRRKMRAQVLPSSGALRVPSDPVQYLNTPQRRRHICGDGPEAEVETGRITET